MTDDEMKKRKSMGDLMREEEVKMLKAAREHMRQEQKAWDEMKAVLARVGVKHGR